MSSFFNDSIYLNLIHKTVIDNGKIVSVLLLDMSAAFNSIDHDLLLKTLKILCGIDKFVLNWLSLY